MEDWAERIDKLMKAKGITQADIARACKIQPGSVSGWFGGGKATKMISGDNLVTTAALLETSAEYIITGRPTSPPGSPSQPLGLDLEKLSLSLAVVEGAIAEGRRRIPPGFKANMIKRVYESKEPLTAQSAVAVQAALAGIFENLGDD